MVAGSESPILDRILKPISDSLNREAADKLLSLKADPSIVARLSKLARKCNDGVMKPAERLEYESLVLAGELVAILQANARLNFDRKLRLS
jgi:hypothetical protein